MIQSIEDLVAKACATEHESQGVFTKRIVAVFAGVGMPIKVARTIPNKRLELRCHRHGTPKPQHNLDPSKYRKSSSKKVGCTFGFNATKPKGGAGTFLLTDESKAELLAQLSSENYGHLNHEAFVGAFEARYVEMRQIDVCDIPVVEALARNNVSTKKIRDAVKAIEKHCAGPLSKGVPPYRLCESSRKDKESANITTQKETKLAEGLEYLKSQGFIFEFLVDEDQCIVAVFWCSEQEKSQARRYHNVMSTDTCHGAIHGMKSCSVTGVNNEFLTICFAHFAFL
ncbi:hypothetical protein BCR33DRAFT_742771 [Rhizoclosmatium globosum]|uniref:FAR1 domain-containing protein n=1 Tax=Rhizoclosmatium globosum TaxID=329046 RepID=A0A1Y2BPI9_9FUNG|nr:hypothetical protein BCR33DRAFT_742771 [Rhizoclosmatium globosum]|eukprot:ORY36517.1 hypothetical protein BCR33DRAFT_742771 [Rhizoclosmatium globosum]